LTLFSTKSISGLVQSDQKMIDYRIFGEILENGEGALGRHFKSSYLFFHTAK